MLARLSRRSSFTTLQLWICSLCVCYLSDTARAFSTPWNRYSSSVYTVRGRGQLQKMSNDVASITGIHDDLRSCVQISTAGTPKLQFEKLFEAFAKNQYFSTHVWQSKPYYVDVPLDCVAGAYTMEDVQMAVDGDFLEAGRGTFHEDRGGWNMAAVSTPRGNSFQDAKLRFVDVAVAMKETSGTVVFNSAGAFIPKLAQVCLAAANAFDMPCALNMYLTNPGQKISAPPHTDKQDVFVIQTQGQKGWKVFTPPPPSRMPRADPLARGKSKDKLDLSELSTPLLDIVLKPGQVLYIPAGFPHTTDTICRGQNDDNQEPSVHLTVGVDTHIWGLNYASMREFSIRRSGLEDKVLLTKLADDLYWKLQSTVPLGFIAAHEQHRQSMNSYIVKQFIDLVRAAEPLKWPDSESSEHIATILSGNEVMARLLRHHRIVTDIFKSMYNDVAYQITPTKMNLSFFRSQPYLQQLEKVMEELHEWAKPVESVNDTKKGSSRQKKGFGSK